MPKPRRKKAKAAEPTAVFVHVPTPELVVIEDLETLTNLDVAGRFVKLAPKIRTSQRDAFDGADVAARIREAGALAVIIAPVFLSETKKEVETVAQAPTDREAVRAWFVAQTIADPADLKAAEEVFGLQHPDVNTVVGIATSAFPINANDALWAKYELGKHWEVKDPATGEWAARNVFAADPPPAGWPTIGT